MDRDISNGLENLKVAEGIVGQKFLYDFSGDKYKNPAKKVDYNFAPALDGNIIDSQKNLADTEAKLDHKYELLQLDSDPICSSAGCDQYKHPEKKDDWDKDYFVPHFGMDRDIQGSFENLKVAEGIVGEKFSDNFDGDKYKNPAKKVDYNFAPELEESQGR
jgi:hypothetical protein